MMFSLGLVPWSTLQIFRSTKELSTPGQMLSRLPDDSEIDRDRHGME